MRADAFDKLIVGSCERLIATGARRGRVSVLSDAGDAAGMSSAPLIPAPSTDQAMGAEASEERVYTYKLNPLLESFGPLSLQNGVIFIISGQYVR